MSRRGAARSCAAVLVAIVLLAAGCTADEPRPSAAEQVPQLTAVLERVDSALAEHRFAAARQQLKNLKAEVVEARDAGALGDADARRILDAVSRLLSMLPAAEPSESPDVESPSAAESSRPSAPKSSRPVRPKTTAPTPDVVPSPTPPPATSDSPSPSITSDPTPTDSATRDGAPTASPSPTGG
jgi:hypothetical protein